MSSLKIKNFVRFLFLYTLLVILWGAWVRISHSGDGCGESWPLCAGQFIPEEASSKTWIEYLHRATSGIYGLLILGLYLLKNKIFPTQDLGRWLISALGLLTIIESLLGAKLVIFKLVGANGSIWRTLAMSLHMTNSLVLMSVISLLVIYTNNPTTISIQKFLKSRYIKNLFIPFIVVCIFGAIAALAGTLFPSLTLQEGLIKDFSENAHYLLRLRILHPILAILFLVFISYYFFQQLTSFPQEEKPPQVKKQIIKLIVFLIIGLVLGFLTLFSLSPVYLKMIHLAWTHCVWFVLIETIYTLVVSEDSASR